MKNAMLNDPQQLERKLLTVFERHGSNGRAITFESLAANVGMQQQAKDLLLALGNLVRQGLVERAGENPIPGSPVAFRLRSATSPNVLLYALAAAGRDGTSSGKELDQGSSSKLLKERRRAA